MGSFYGDPKCGLIGSNNNWCIVGGDTLRIWYYDKSVLTVEDDELEWILKIRQISPNEVEILIDPWSDKGSVLIFSVKMLERRKIKDFKKLNEEYSEGIDW